MSVTATEDDYAQLETKQRLKAAIHYTVGRICEETSQDMNVRFSKQFVAALSEATDKLCQRLAVDLELFARHAKRTTINADDVKLFVRRSSQLYDHIEKMEEKQVQEKKSKKSDKKRKTTDKETAMSENGDTIDNVEDDISNM